MQPDTVVGDNTPVGSGGYRVEIVVWVTIFRSLFCSFSHIHNRKGWGRNQIIQAIRFCGKKLHTKQNDLWTITFVIHRKSVGETVAERGAIPAFRRLSSVIL